MIRFTGPNAVAFLNEVIDLLNSKRCWGLNGGPDGIRFMCGSSESPTSFYLETKKGDRGLALTAYRIPQFLEVKINPTVRSEDDEIYQLLVQIKGILDEWIKEANSDMEVHAIKEAFARLR